MKEPIRNSGKQKTERGAVNGAQTVPEKLYVNVMLQGDEVGRFLAHKRDSFLRSNSEVGRSLMLAHLKELQPAA